MWRNWKSLQKNVNSKFRQLRFSAFGSANKVPENCPLVKLALIKRAFRKKPAHGYCPSPEQDWAKYEPLHVRDLEALLRFFHGNCMSVLDEMTPQSRSKTLANLDLACIEAFHAAKMKKSARDDIRRSMLVTSAKYATELGVAEKTLEGVPWIDFGSAIQQDQGKVEKVDIVWTKIIKFDEKTGEQLSAQVEVPQSSKQERQLVKLPWQEWIQASLYDEEPG